MCHFSADDPGEDDRVIVLLVASSEYQRGAATARERCESADEVRVGSKFPLVPALELRPLLRVVREPPSKLRGGRELLHPVVDRDPFLAETSGPEPVHENASTVGPRRGFVSALQL
jgi:hypothetical protein